MAGNRHGSGELVKADGEVGVGVVIQFNSKAFLSLALSTKYCEEGSLGIW